MNDATTGQGAKATSKAVRIVAVDYDRETLDQKEVDSFEACRPFLESPERTWIHVQGRLGGAEAAAMGKVFGLEPYTLEAFVDPDQSATFEDAGAYLFCSVRLMSDAGGRSGMAEQKLRLILGRNYVLSVQDGGVDVFAPVRARIQQESGRIRRLGHDELLHALMDAAVEREYVAVEKLDERIEALEARAGRANGSEALHDLFQIKREVLMLRKAFWPLRDAVAALAASDSPLLGEGSGAYFRDLHGRVLRLLELVETLRELLSGLHDIYLTALSLRLNEVMKVLTLIATIFMPLTFMAGVYGMNFQHMPELGWRWGYPMVLGVMLSVGVGMVLYFKRKKWL